LERCRRTIEVTGVYRRLSGRQGGVDCGLLGSLGLSLVADRLDGAGNPVGRRHPQDLVYVLPDLRLGQRTGEDGHWLTLDHGEHRRDALDCEGCGHPLVGVHIDLRKHPTTTALLCQPLEDRRQLLAGAAPIRPEIDEHGHLYGAVYDLGLERLLGDLHDVRGAVGTGTAWA